jgi:hypothetical protein
MMRRRDVWRLVVRRCRMGWLLARGRKAMRGMLGGGLAINFLVGTEYPLGDGDYSSCAAGKGHCPNFIPIHFNTHKSITLVGMELVYCEHWRASLELLAITY